MSTLLIPKPAGTVTSVNSQTGNVSLSTNSIPENGSLYFTSARAAASISAVNTAGDQNGISYNNSTGVLTISADYLAATPYTFVLRDGTGSIIGYNGNFTKMTVYDVLSCHNTIYTENLYVKGTITAESITFAEGITIINDISGNDFVVEQLYINSNQAIYISAVLSLSSQTDVLPVGGIVIDPSGGTSFTTIIATGNLYTPTVSATQVQVQVSAWIPAYASYKFTMISGVSNQQTVSVVLSSCQTVVFAMSTDTVQ